MRPKKGGVVVVGIKLGRGDWAHGNEGGLASAVGGVVAIEIHRHIHSIWSSLLVSGSFACHGARWRKHIWSVGARGVSDLLWEHLVARTPSSSSFLRIREVALGQGGEWE